MSGKKNKKIKKYFLSEDRFLPKNSADPDEMQHYAAFHLELHCLPMYPFRGKFQYYRVKVDK